MRALRALFRLMRPSASGTWVNYSDGTANETGSYVVTPAQQAAFHAKQRWRHFRR